VRVERDASFSRVDYAKMLGMMDKPEIDSRFTTVVRAL
jgi:hypothetical protein